MFLARAKDCWTYPPARWPLPWNWSTDNTCAGVKTNWGENDASRDFAFCEWDLRASRCGVDLWLRTVRTATHKLTFESNSRAGELYDLRNDPQEMDNRFGDPGVAKVQRELMDMIASRPDDKVEPLPQVGMA